MTGTNHPGNLGHHKKTNRRTTEIEAREGTHVKGTENKIMEEKFPKLKKEVLTIAQEVYRTPNR